MAADLVQESLTALVLAVWMFYLDAHLTVFEYVGLKDYIGSLFDGPVDVVNRDGLKSYVRPAATADAIYAF